MDICVVDNIGDLSRFELTYSLILKTNRIFLKTTISSRKFILSLSGIYASAIWLEREVWDMFGIIFYGHTDLRRILTDYGFSGHPLRKDFPLTGFFEIRYNDSCGYIISQPVLLAQEFRVFTLENPWIRNNKITKKRSYNLINI